MLIHELKKLAQSNPQIRPHIAKALELEANKIAKEAEDKILKRLKQKGAKDIQPVELSTWQGKAQLKTSFTWTALSEKEDEAKGKEMSILADVQSLVKMALGKHASRTKPHLIDVRRGKGQQVKLTVVLQ